MWQFINSRLIEATVSTLIVFPSLAWGQSADSRTQVVELFQQAQHAEQANDRSKASDIYRAILAIDPNIAEVWSNLGMALYQQDRYKDSIPAFERAATLKPTLLAPHLFAGLAYQQMGDATKALTPLKAALALEPNQPEATAALSDAYAQTRQFEASVLLLQSALKHNPDSETLESNLAVTYLDWAKDIGDTLRRSPSLYGSLLSDRVHAANDPGSADAAFRNTVASASVSTPGSMEAHLAYARFLMENQPTAEKLQASKEQIEAARQISPHDLDVAAAEVQLAAVQKNIPRAFALLSALLEEDHAFTLANLDTLADGMPSEDTLKIKELAASQSAHSSGYPESYTNKFAALEAVRSKRLLTITEDADYASVAWHLHRYDEVLSELVKRHRTDAANQYWLFRICEALGRETLEYTVNTHPDSLRSHLLLADFAIQQGNFKVAQSEYEAALSLSPNDPEIMLLHVHLLESMSEYEQALQEAMHGAANFPQNASLNFEAGELTLRSSSDAGAAARYLEQALQADSRLIRARTDLSDAYAQLNRFDDAVREVIPILNTDEDGALHYRLARWYRQTGHAEEASKALEISKRIKEQRIEKERNGSAGRSISQSKTIATTK
jgi:tetratricopeptide (TPR) repeat protein